MYKKFKLPITDTEYQNNLSAYLNEGRTIYKNNKLSVKNSFSRIENYIENNSKNSLDGSKIIEEWFPEIKSDIFISHSHQDEEKSIALAGFLKLELGIDSFIDSVLWGHSKDLMKELNDKYSRHHWNQYLYDYDDVMYVASNIHMMLSVALANMIDKSECIIFINTENAFNPTSNHGAAGYTYSPWIYMELSSIENIRITTPKRISAIAMEDSGEVLAKGRIGFSIKHKVDIDHLDDLELSRIYLAHSEGKTGTSALDFIYSK